jgi:hypothetical protein
MADGPRPRSPTNRRVISFGWELVDLFNDGADVYYPVEADIDVTSLDVDIATMLFLLPTAPGTLEVLCTGAVGRGAPPSFGSPPEAVMSEPASSDFGALTTYNPSGLDVAVNPSTPGQGGFLRIILKAWSPADGAASSTFRHVRTTPDLRLQKGDYLGFHMEHSGLLVDAELQVVIGYYPRN